MTALDAAGPTRPSLLLQLRDHQNHKAWETFHQVYAPLVKAYAQRKGLCDADADDVTQQVMIAVTKAIGNFEYSPERGSFRAWLGQVVFNHLKKFWSGKATSLPIAKMENLLPLDQLSQTAFIVDPDWLAHFTQHVLTVAMQRIREEFEANTWMMFLNVWEQKLPPQIVAQNHDSSIHAVYVAKSRVLKRLRDEVQMLVDDMPTQN